MTKRRNPVEPSSEIGTQSQANEGDVEMGTVNNTDGNNTRLQREGSAKSFSEGITLGGISPDAISATRNYARSSSI